VPSPDKRLEVNIYNRSCKSGSLMTYAAIHDPRARWSWPNRNDVCILPSLTGGYHDLQAVWTDRTHITISSRDLLKDDNRYLRPDRCADVDISYDLKLEPLPPDLAPDEQTVADIRRAIDLSESCLSPPSFAIGHADVLRRLVNSGRHREALDLLVTNLNAGSCPISDEAYAVIERAARRMDLSSTLLPNLTRVARAR
jgi:hypothetical protein